MANRKDPVCGMEINENDAAGRSTYQGKDCYFCAEDCRRRFEEDPERYADKPNGD